MARYIALPFFSILLFACNHGVDYPPGSPEGPINVARVATGQKSTFHFYVIPGGSDAPMEQKEALKAEVVHQTGDEVTIRMQETGAAYGDTLPHDVTYRRSDGAVVSGTPQYDFFESGFALLGKYSIKEMLDGQRYLFDGPIPKGSADFGGSFQGYGTSLEIGGRQYPKAAFTCHMPGIPDMGNSCLFFSEDGRLLRVLSYGGFIDLKASYWDLELED
jgi:hypothetical protein